MEQAVYHTCVRMRLSDYVTLMINDRERTRSKEEDFMLYVISQCTVHCIMRRLSK